MNTNTRISIRDGFRIGFIEPAPELRTRGFELRKFVGRVVHGTVTFAKAVSAARDAAYLAERYYAMNNAQLKRVGLTRDGIPAELLRTLGRD